MNTEAHEWDGLFFALPYARMVHNEQTHTRKSKYLKSTTNGKSSLRPMAGFHTNSTEPIFSITEVFEAITLRVV